MQFTWTETSTDTFNVTQYFVLHCCKSTKANNPDKCGQVNGVEGVGLGVGVNKYTCMLSQQSIITDTADKLPKSVNTLKQSEVLHVIILPVSGIVLTSHEQVHLSWVQDTCTPELTIMYAIQGMKCIHASSCTQTHSLLYWQFCIQDREWSV